MKKPSKFFTMETFGTLGGCAIAAWLVASVISGVFGINAKYLGFFVSIGVAYIALFRTKEIKPAQYGIAFINGCLIYMTVVGGTSFMSTKPAVVLGTERPSVRSNISSPWITDVKPIKQGAEVIADLRTDRDNLHTTLDSVVVERDSCVRLIERKNIMPGGLNFIDPLDPSVIWRETEKKIKLYGYELSPP
jgi:hypothetical protein